jgi:CrcB protein
MLGALARAALGELLPHSAGTWPWATFAVNVAGAALLGAVLVRAPVHGPTRPFLAGGLCGALTTFSGLQLELLELLDHGRVELAALYASATVTAGLGAMRLAQRA